MSGWSVYATGLGPVSGAMVTGSPASSTSLQPHHAEAGDGHVWQDSR